MPTIKDVARLAGVGTGTVSRYLSGNGSVAPATAERIRTVVDELHFRPSQAARSLMTGSTQMIGVFIPFLSGTYYTPILQVIDSALRGTGRHMVVAFGQIEGDERAQAIDGIRFLLERDCDGLIVLSNALQDEDLKALKDAQQHLCILNRHFDRIREQCFTADHVRGGVVAAQALLEHHHERIAVITGPASSPDSVARVAGFMGELALRGIDTSRILTLGGDFSPEGGWRAAQQLAQSIDRFTAVFCANDETALGVLSYFQEQGISVPHDVSVLGYDDTQTAAMSAPRLTSVHIPMREVALNGLHWLMNRCYGSDLPVVREFEITLTRRASVAAPRQHALSR